LDIKDAMDLVSVSLTQTTSTSGNAASNHLLVLNNKKSKEHAKLNRKTGASHVRKNSPCSRQPWHERCIHNIHDFASWAATSASPNKRMSSNRETMSGGGKRWGENHLTKLAISCTRWYAECHSLLLTCGPEHYSLAQLLHLTTAIGRPACFKASQKWIIACFKYAK
jgi:hypothetical protein